MNKLKYSITIFFLLGAINYSFCQENCDKALAYKDKIKINHRYAYAAHYFALKCECVDNGAISDEQEIQLFEAMEHDRKSFQAYGGSLSELGPLPNECKRRSPNSNDNGSKNGNTNNQANNTSVSNNLDSEWDKLNNVSDIQGFVGLVAENSDSEAIKEMSSKLNKSKETFSLIKDVTSDLGLVDASSLDFIENVEFLNELFIVGKGLFESFKEAQLTPEQEEVIKKMHNLNYSLKEIYSVTNSIPIYYEFNERTLTELEKKEITIKNYGRHTIKERLLYLLYFNSEDFWNNSILESTKKQILNWEKNNGIDFLYSKLNEELKKVSNEYLVEEKDFEYTSTAMIIEPHLFNETKSNKGSLHNIAIQKAKCYRALGQINEAKKIENNLNFDISATTCITQLIDNLKRNNNRNAVNYYEVFKQHILNTNEFKYIYSGVRQLSYDNIDGLYRKDVQIINLAALRAYLSLQDYQNAKNVLEFMTNYHNEFVHFLELYEKKNIRKRFMGLTVTEIETEINKSLNLLSIGKLLYNNDYENLDTNDVFLNTINAYKSSILFNDIKSLLLFYKSTFLIKNNDFTKAKDCLKELKDTYSFSTTKSQMFFSKEDITFLKAFINKKQNKNSLVVIGLKSILKNKPNDLRSLRLLYETYIDLQKNTEAKEILEKIKLLTT